MLDNEDDENEHDGAGEPDRGKIEVEIGSGTWVMSGHRYHRELRDVLRYYLFKKKSAKYSTK